MSLDIFFIQCLNSLQYGLLLFLVASGLSLIFGMMGVINLAHGSFYMMGAYFSFMLAPPLTHYIGEGGFFLMLFIASLLSLAFGYLLEWVFFSFLYKRNHLQQVLMTYGLILVVEESLSILFGNEVHSIKIPELLQINLELGGIISYPIYRIFISILCLALTIGMFFVFSKTKIGLRVRAGSQNLEMIQILGVNIKILYRLVFAAGVALASLAGMLAFPLSAVYPGMGNQVLIICFVVVVIGGIGSVKGAMVASILIGFVETFGQVLLPQYSGVLLYLMMAIILFLKPEGLVKNV